MRTPIALAAVVCLAGTPPAAAQYPYPARVELRFDHWYGYDEMTRALHDLAAAYPELLRLESIGKSVAGRDLWLVTINNPATGPDTAKTAMFIDGNKEKLARVRPASLGQASRISGIAPADLAVLMIYLT